MIEQARTVGPGAVLDERRHQRHAERAAELPHHVGHRRALRDVLTLQARERQSGQRHEEESETDAAQDQRPEEICFAGRQRRVRQQVGEAEERDEPERIEDLRREPPLHQLADDRHHDRRGERARQQDEARLHRGEAEQVLGEHREDEHRAVEAEAEDESKQRPYRQRAVLEHAEIDHRMLGRQLAPDEGRDAEDGGRREPADVSGGKPVFRLAAFEHDLE